ncbi:hypothetical protein BE08_43070 [Sorangium cellulosum]|uniref:Uncharacterized protein n=1 Tax=Sorangium cellulosum TaxID=56 RepID=A0A150P1Q1_SORCE|nr:hypothetical protein BE08_43070 [Sorangium cellulosum]
MPAEVRAPLVRDDGFDEYINADGPVVIAGREFLRSNILASDEDYYREALLEWRQEQLDELLETATERFPHPIAHCLYRYLNSARTENERLQFLKDTWESIIEFVYALTLAEVRARESKIAVTATKTRDFRRYLDSRNVRDRLEVVCVVYESSVDLPLLRSTVSRTAVERMIRLNAHRNEDFAHLGTLSDRQSSALIAELEPEVYSVLREVSALERVEIVRFDRPGPRRAEGVFETFLGHASTRTVETRVMSPQIAAALIQRSSNDVFLKSGEELFPLSPIIVWRDARGHRSELAFMKKRRVERGHSIFTFEAFGVAEEFEDDSAELVADLDAIKALFESAKETNS